MTNLRGVGGAPRGLRTHQPSLHGRRPHEIRRTTAPTRRASSQRSTARRDSANATIIPPTNERQSTTNEKSSHPLPTHLQLNPNQLILKAMIRGITPSHGQAKTHSGSQSLITRLHSGMLNTPGDREKIWTDSKTDAWKTKGADGTISKGGNHR